VADDSMTPGEIARTFQRHAEDLRSIDGKITDLAKAMVPTELWAAEHRALQNDLVEHERDTRDAFTRAEATSLERRSALQTKDAELEARIEALRKDVFRKIADLEASFNAKLNAERQRATNEEAHGTAKTANWIALAIALISVAGLIVALLGQGGK
jgi:hypothetical protein